jgi:hypothetical protein
MYLALCKIIHTLSCKQELYEHWWIVRTFWRYQSGNQKPNNQRRTDNPLAKRKLTNNDLQNTPQKTTDQAIRTSLKTWGHLIRKGKRFCFTCCTRRVTFATNPVISHECGQNRIVNTTSGTYPWSFVTQILRSG